QTHALQPIAVSTAVAGPVDLPVVLEVRGQVVGDREARVAAGATGRVVDVVAERGTRVARGDTLARLDDRLLTASRDEARAALAQAVAHADVADADCARAEALFAKGLSNEAAVQQARSACAAARATAEGARARLASAEARLSDTRIRAPFAGVVSERLVSPGEYVRDDSGVVGLVGTTDLRLELTIGEREAHRIAGGEVVRFRVAGDDHDRQAVIDRISPALRDKGRDLVVEAAIDAADLEGLRPGAFARGGVQSEVRTVVAVPEAAIARDGSATRAWVVTEGHAEERVVAVGRAESGRVPVLDGLSAGERVITPVPAGLHDGAPVTEGN
ncbi:MAG: efflux RND transporter periplasmic adaptor subunit, partial [Myxococcales bacterium]|nr:efflux RND transporter periplasmic adaptor subunit [Myxococcales bacterium]